MPVNISFVAVGANADQTKFPAAIASTLATAANITPSGSNQQSSVSCPSTGAPMACRVATDAAIYVAFGANPDATSGNRVWMPANSVEYFMVSGGDKAAVISG